MTEIIPFAYGEQPVRVVEIDGEPWFGWYERFEEPS